MLSCGLCAVTFFVARPLRCRQQGILAAFALLLYIHDSAVCVSLNACVKDLAACRSLSCLCQRMRAAIVQGNLAMRYRKLGPATCNVVVLIVALAKQCALTNSHLQGLQSNCGSSVWLLASPIGSWMISGPPGGHKESTTSTRCSGTKRAPGLVQEGEMLGMARGHSNRQRRSW